MAVLEDIDRARPLPRHVAIIMDGNGRWAREHRLRTRLQGHEAGAESVRAVLRAAEAIERLEVHWPDGTTQSVAGAGVDRAPILRRVY